MHGDSRTFTRLLRCPFGVLVAILVGASVTVCASTSIPRVHGPKTFLQIAPDSGLADSAVFTTIQDQKGFMWFGTENGLMRYDGRRVHVFRSDLHDSDSLNESDVSVLLTDRSGLLWIGTWGGGLHKFDPVSENFTRFEARPGDPSALRDGRIQSLLLDKEGALWVGTFAGGLSRFDEATGSFQTWLPNGDQERTLPSNRVWDLAEDPSGGLWIATDNGLVFFDKERGAEWTLSHDPKDPASLPHEVVRTVFVDRKGVVWVGLESGFGTIDREHRRFERFQPPDPDADALQSRPINTLIEDEIGRIWIGTVGAGLFVIDGRDNQVVQHRHRSNRTESLPNDDVRALFVDASNLLWIGTRGGGICRLDLKPAKFISINADPETPNALSDPAVFSVYEDSSGTLWIGTQEGLNRRLPGEVGFTVIHHDQALSGTAQVGAVNAILETGDGILWFGSWGGGLTRLDPGTGHFSTFRHEPGNPRSLSSDRVSSLAETKDASLWVGTGSGLNRLDRIDGSFRRFTSEPGVPGTLTDDYIRRLYIGREGELWVGTDHGGLARYDANREAFDIFDTGKQTGLIHNRILAITEDTDGVMWIGTVEGLHTFDPASGNFTHAPISGELATAAIQNVIEDDDGHLWLASNHGLSRWNPDTGDLRTYTKSDHIQGYAFSSAYFKTSDGRIYVGGLNGLNVFRPEDVTDNPHAPPVALTAVHRFNEAVDFELPLACVKEITFPHTDNFFTIEFAALEYTDPGRNLFAYRLEGFDTEWVQAGNRNFASYTNVDPGTYEFRVIAANSDCVWNTQGVSMTINITPPWWQRWWFRTIAAVGLGLLAFAVVSLRTRVLRLRAEELAKTVAEKTKDLEQANAAKGQFLANMSHEMRTPLHGVIGMLQLALKTDLSHQQKQFLKFAYSSAESLLGLIGDILDLSKIDAGGIQLGNEVFELQICITDSIKLAATAPQTRGVEVTWDVHTDVPKWLRGDVFRLKQILTNLVSNALKFTEEGTISVTAELDSVHLDSLVLHFSVTDTGIGIPEDKLDSLFEPFTQVDGSLARRVEGTGLGLAICKNLVELMGGRIWVETEVARGSIFHFTALFSEAPSQQKQDSATVTQWAPLPIDRVLVVDDNDVNRIMGQLFVEQLGCGCDVAEGGEEALRALKSSVYQVVLLDLQMPVMDGIETARHIRKELPDDQQPWIIALTAAATPEDRENCFAAGMNDFLSKPVLIEDLHDKLSLSCKVSPDAGPDVEPVDQLVDDHVDLQYLNEMRESVSEGETDFLKKVIAAFERTVSDQLAAMKQALAEGDSEALERAAHSVKGCSLQLGGKALGKLCSELEEAAKFREPSCLSEQVGAIEIKFEKTLVVFEKACE